jgi:hypothetical protein
LPKYVGFFEAFLKHEPAAATDMFADRNPPSKRGLFFPVPLIRMVYEANPAAISHQGSSYAFNQCFCNSDIDSVRYVLTVSRGRKLKDPMVRQFCTMQCVAAGLENIRLAHSYRPENISVKAADSCLPLHSFVYMLPKVLNAVRVAMETVRFLSNIILLELQRLLKLMVRRYRQDTMHTCAPATRLVELEAHAAAAAACCPCRGPSRAES